MKRTRVVFLTGSLRMGGTERNILHLATHLDKTRFEVHVWSDYEGEPLQARLRAGGIPCRSLKHAPSLGRPLWARIFRHNLPYQWRLFQLLRSNRDAVIHAFGFPMAYYAVILGRLAGCRRILFAVQDWDVWKRSGVYAVLDRVCSRLAWRVVADGAGARRLAVRRQGMDAGRLITIYDGVNTAELKPRKNAAALRKELGLAAERPTVGVIARLDLAKKAQDVFLRALPRIARAHPEAQFLLVGDGPDREKVESLRAELPPAARPVMTGNRMDLADVLAMLEVLVIPSRWESVPKILLEAMWLGKAIVAAGVGDIREILDHTCGIVITPGRPGELADAVCGLLADPGRRAALGRAAHDRIVARALTLEASVKTYETLYATR